MVLVLRILLAIVVVTLTRHTCSATDTVKIKDGKNLSETDVKDRLNSPNSDAIFRGKTTGSRFMDGSQKIETPFFDDFSPRNVTAIVGQSAILHCRVKHLGQRTVSWMRKRDLHILTSSIFTYTGDARFGVIHPEGSDDWNLKIEYVQKRDAGIYECQVNTEPKINMAVYLHAEDKASEGYDGQGRNSARNQKYAAQATIQGPEDVYVKKGSTISLTCSVNVHSTPPSSVFWYHGPAVVDFDSPRGGISLETEKTESGTTSRLLVTKASLVDSGNYTCVPSNANPSSVWVHVLNGEHPAAMQHGEHSGGSTSGVGGGNSGSPTTSAFRIFVHGLALTYLFRWWSHVSR